MTTKSIQYVATLPRVREVSIVGTADLGFWAGRLRTEDLVPLDVDGRAQVLLIAADARFKGVPFQELSVSISLAQGAGAFLAQAFNSNRFFAFCERTFFRTPYAFGNLRVSAALPASVQLTRGREQLFRAEMGAGAAPEALGASPYEQGWDGPIFLPSGRVFFAKIRGAAQPVAFQAPRDVVEIRPAKDLPVLQALIDSGFQATHWLIRREAVHAKSKTYDRSAAGMSG